MASPQELIIGAADLHIHSGPSMIPRAYDHVEIARSCIEAGMRAIVVKDHHSPTGNVCQIIQRYLIKPSDNFNIYGSVTLNNAQGGINPSVIEAEIANQAKIVWFPTLSAAYHRERFRYLQQNDARYAAPLPAPARAIAYDPPISVLNSDGKLVDGVPQILKLIADGDAILATGHISKRETYAVLDEAVKQGVKKIIITHAEFFRDFSFAEMRDFVKAGFYVEHVITPLYSGYITYDEFYALVRNHGLERTIISTDLGQVGRPSPAKGLFDFIVEMQKRGLTDDEIRQITGKNQRILLGLEENNKS